MGCEKIYLIIKGHRGLNPKKQKQGKNMVTMKDTKQEDGIQK
jgi:hypothetical protein